MRTRNVVMLLLAVAVLGTALSLIVAGTVVFAHEGNEHVRGGVTQISAQSITVQTAPKTTRTAAHK